MELVQDEQADLYANIGKLNNKLDISKSKPHVFKFGKFVSQKDGTEQLLQNDKKETTIAVFRVAIGKSFPTRVTK